MTSGKAVKVCRLDKVSAGLPGRQCNREAAVNSLANRHKLPAQPIQLIQQAWQTTGRRDAGFGGGIYLHPGATFAKMNNSWTNSTDAFRRTRVRDRS
jgi:hypothetical protein